MHNCNYQATASQAVKLCAIAEQDLNVHLQSFWLATLVTREQAQLSINTKDPELNEWPVSPYTVVGNYYPIGTLRLCLHFTVRRRVVGVCFQTCASSLVCCELCTLHVNLTMSCCVSFQGGLLLKIWQKAMSTEAGRKMGRKLMEELVSSQKFDPVGMYNDLKRVDLTAFSFLRRSSSNSDWFNLLADMCLVIWSW